MCYEDRRGREGHSGTCGQIPVRATWTCHQQCQASGRQFQRTLARCGFLFADEAFFAGDKQHVGVLKALITEPYLTIEGKYQNAVQMPNFLHVMMASNEEWGVPASLDSRRWLVIDVQGNKINAHSYFGAIQEQLDGGGHAAMLHDLLNRDLSKSNLRAVPVTDALQTQRKMSLDTTHRWWVDCLHREYVFQSCLGFEDYFGQWHDFLTTEVLYVSYSRYCTEARERRPLSRELFGRWMGDQGDWHSKLSGVGWGILGLSYFYHDHPDHPEQDR